MGNILNYKKQIVMKSETSLITTWSTFLNKLIKYKSFSVLELVTSGGQTENFKKLRWPSGTTSKRFCRAAVWFVRSGLPYKDGGLYVHGEEAGRGRCIWRADDGLISGKNTPVLSFWWSYTGENVCLVTTVYLSLLF